MKPISRQAILGVAFGAGLLACSGDPVGSQEAAGTLALVGFHQTVDRSLLERAGAAVLQVFESPPAARVRASASVLSGLESEPAVAFVTPEVQDSISAFVTFHDRATGDDPVSAADSAAVRAAGGRIKYIYDDPDPSIAVVIPQSAVEALRSQPAVKEVAPITSNVFTQ